MHGYHAEMPRWDLQKPAEALKKVLKTLVAWLYSVEDINQFVENWSVKNIIEMCGAMCDTGWYFGSRIPRDGQLSACHLQW